MRKITLIQLAILFIIGLIPLFWLKTGYIISFGDDFVLFLNANKTFSSTTDMWSPNYLGYAVPTPAYFIYMYTASFLNYSGLSISWIQILFQIFFLIGAGFSMYYLSKTIYPELRLTPFIASFFYMFNFFAMQNRQNIGFMWTYTFLPLLLALFLKTIHKTYQNNNKTLNKGIIYFALASVLAFSLASINPSNVILIVLGLIVLAIYSIIKYRKRLRPLLSTFGKIIGISIPINLWWVIPMLNTYVFSPQMLNSQITVEAWSWTHVRASFLNLFWLNGFWGWLPEYVPNYYAYFNPLFIISVFIPFLIAASSLLFKSPKLRFNAFIMLSMLFFIFLAKGLHEPLGGINLFLYQYVPGMNMFREPASKFTFIIIPFLALLIGYGSESVASIKSSRFNFPSRKLIVSIFLILVLFLPIYPFAINPIETKTDQLPFSSYTKIPDYWFQATDWINRQDGNWKVLITPFNDFYMMPYEWGFYGTDQLVERLFEKPLVSTANLDGYIINPDVAPTLRLMRDSMKYNRIDEFAALLDLLNIKYIFQRNDVRSDFEERDLMSPAAVKSFLSKVPNVKMVQEFGQIEIYEYTEFKPLLYAVNPEKLSQIEIKIETVETLSKEWNFSKIEDVQEWQKSNLSNHSQMKVLNQDSDYLKAELWDSTSSWTTVDSPLLPAQHENKYTINLTLTGYNTSKVRIQIAEYDDNMSLITNTSTVEVSDRDFDGINFQFQFEPESLATKFFNIQIWNYFKANETSKSILWLDTVNVTGQISNLKMEGIENLFSAAEQDQVASLQNVRWISPEKILVSVNATKPFILATSQALDNFWVAYVNGQEVQPVDLYLGLRGFLINATGQLEVTFEYKPQLWFYYASIISLSTLAVLFLFYLYMIRDSIKIGFGKFHRRKD